jgi:hypothetical protein
MWLAVVPDGGFRHSEALMITAGSFRSFGFIECASRMP